MKQKGLLLIALLISLFSLMAFSLMAILISGKRIVQFDQKVISFVQGFETSLVTSIMKFFTFIGSMPVVLVIVLIALIILDKVLKHRTELVLFVVVIIGTPVLNQLLKFVFQRSRPDIHRLIEVGGYSFPSGHAMNAFAVYGIISFLLWRHIPTFLGRTTLIIISGIFIFMIGISRIYLGVHYPSDIIGGYFASSFWLASAIWFFYRLKSEANRKKTLVE
ncbi:phosphatase PAP2 family protein [Peribacillus huizhouensis]|uniref:Undecaprenyl-diphosphatase n=1 Tax=Peribacillus huizhouensis TaxID=1501239 RepID=A0ABR6CP74_9BACI|nr:phosphatase PAP2 family protein [Peribacillus huizhouensis]MBA9026172.1 undecaprenyl-diphosphatase [Peribacillus huizhouensis]